MIVKGFGYLILIRISFVILLYFCFSSVLVLIAKIHKTLKSVFQNISKHRIKYNTIQCLISMQ